MGTNGELVTNRRVPFLMSVPNTMSLVAEIFEKGFVELKDPEMGHLVGEMERHSLLSAPGLALLNNILHNLSLQGIAQSLLGKCKLGHWLKYEARPGHIEGWRTGGTEAGLRVLLVLAFAKGSRVVYYSGSQVHDLPVLKTERYRGLPETTRDALTRAGCEPVERDYANGALVVIDARLYCEIQSGNVIKHEIIATDALSRDRDALGVEESLEETVKRIQSTIGINYEIIRRPANTARS